MIDELPEGFQVVEEVDVGDLTNVKEAKPLIPPTNNVVVQIKRVTPRASKDNAWRWLNLGCKLVGGVGPDKKWAGSYVNTENIPYYADPEKYPDMKTDKGYLGRLGDLQRATGTLGSKVNDEFITALKDKFVVCNIVQINDEYRNEIVNVAKRFRALPADTGI